MTWMAREVRVEYEGAWYHVMARGNRREKIFVDDKDREIFLKTLGLRIGSVWNGIKIRPVWDVF